MTLRAWDKVEEPRKKSTSVTKIKQGSGEGFADFLQRLVSAVDKAIPDPDRRQVLLETLAFENTIQNVKKLLSLTGAAPMDKWIRARTDTGSNLYMLYNRSCYTARGL